MHHVKDDIEKLLDYGYLVKDADENVHSREVKLD